MSLNFSNNNISDNGNEKIQSELNNSLQKIFKSNKKIIEGLNEIKTVSQWYKDSKTNPDLIPSIILNESIKEIIKYVKPGLSQYLIEKINLQIDIRRNKVTIENIGIIFSIKPYVEYVKKVDNLEINKIKITFNIALSGKAEDIHFSSKNGENQITIGDISTAIKVSILKGEIFINGVNINPITKPIELYHNEPFKIQNILFRLQ